MSTPTSQSLQSPSVQQTQQSAAWQHLQTVCSRWFYRPDYEVLRVCLATAKALDTETKAIWTLLVGPSSCGKTEFYGLAAQAYSPHVPTDDISLPGLMTMTTANRGQGVLQRLGKRGLWLISDYSSILELSEDKRKAVNAACRRIYDGNYSRTLNGQSEYWSGRVNVLAGCTPAIERHTSHAADLGERYIGVRVWKSDENSDEFVHRINAQREDPAAYHNDILNASREFLRPGIAFHAEVPFSLQRLILQWASFVSICRVQVHRNWKEEITSVNQEEGSGRIGGQLLGLACGDSALFGHSEVVSSSLNIIRRVAFDCLPYTRGAILRHMPIDLPIRRVDLQELSGITHPFTFERALDELEAIGVLRKATENVIMTSYSLTDRPKQLLADTAKKLSPLECSTSTLSPLRENEKVG